MLCRRFCHPIGLMVWMTRKHVLEAIVELMGPGLGALIRDGIQYRAVCALSFRIIVFLHVVQPVNFKEVRKVVNCHEVALLLVFKEICSYLHPRAVGYGVADEGFFWLLWRKLWTDIAFWDVVLYFTLHVWPVEGFSCPPYSGLYSLVICMEFFDGLPS